MDTKQIKIVVFAPHALTQRIINELCLDDMAQSFNLEYWNCESVVCTSAVSSVNASRELHRDWVVHIRDRNDFELKLSSLPNDTIGVMYLRANQKMYKIHKLIAKRVQCVVYYNLCNIINDAFLSPTSTDGIQQIVKYRPLKRIKQILYQNDFLYLLSKYIRYNGDARYREAKDSLYISKTRKLFKHVYVIGTPPGGDYWAKDPICDKIASSNDTPILAGPYIVFLDAYWPLHSDWRSWYPDYDWEALAAPYYASMNTFFYKVEKEYKMPIVIAAHPSADYTNNPYGERKCIQYKSVELIRDCEGVIMHSSGSMNFIAYYNKPVCMVYNTPMATPHLYRDMYQMGAHLSAYMKLPFHNIDTIDSVREIFTKIDAGEREKCISRYFGDVKSPLSSAELLKQHLIDIYKRIKQ